MSILFADMMKQLEDDSSELAAPRGSQRQVAASKGTLHGVNAHALVKF